MSIPSLTTIPSLHVGKNSVGANYVTTTQLTTKLNNYVKTDALSTGGADSVTSTQLTTELSNYVKTDALGTASTRDVGETIAFGLDSLPTSNAIYNKLLDYLRSTNIEIGDTISDSTSFVPSSRSVREYVKAIVAALNLGNASTQKVTSAIQSGLSSLPTSNAVWLYMQPFINQLNTVVQWGEPAAAPVVYQGADSGITIEWTNPGFYLYTFAHGLPANALCSVSFERTFSYDGDNGNTSKVSYQLVGNNQIRVAFPYDRVNGRTSLLVFDEQLRQVYGVFSGWSGILLQTTRVVY